MPEVKRELTLLVEMGWNASGTNERSEPTWTAAFPLRHSMAFVHSAVGFPPPVSMVSI